MGKKAVAIKNLSFKFSPTGRFFFKNLTCDFQANKIHFIRGQNGVGKSTFFRLLQGNITKDEQCSGQICVQEKCFTLKKNGYKNLSNYIRMVPQKFDSMLACEFSFRQNLKLANISLYPNFSKLPAHQRIPEFVKTFNIDVDKPVKLLSGGQRQILAILMALQKNTQVLLLDEPTAALDERNSGMVMQFLSNLVKTMDLTVLIICHDKKLVRRYAADGYCQIVLDDQTQERKIKVINHTE